MCTGHVSLGSHCLAQAVYVCVCVRELMRRAAERQLVDRRCLRKEASKTRRKLERATAFGLPIECLDKALEAFEERIRTTYGPGRGGKCDPRELNRRATAVARAGQLEARSGANH